MNTLSLIRSGQLHGIKRLDLSIGLNQFPDEIFELAESLEILNLSGNSLSSLPDDFGRLYKLRILFCSDNLFTEIPEVLGQCPQLSMIGFKANQIRTVPPTAITNALRWLILTDNQIDQLPEELGLCVELQKLMLSGNKLSQLPSEMQACTALELIRIASNRFTTLPDWLLKLPHLSWLACADNPFSDISATSALKNQKEIHREISWSQLAVENKLGEGASGVIYQASLLSETTKQEVAVKLFKGTITSDGSPYSEMAANMNAGSHPNLINIKGKIVDHPEGTPGLVMSLINSSYRNLAGPPSLESCTRDIYASETTFTLQTALEIALGITKAARHLHENGVLHGDLYAHNILHDDTGRCLLGDFGAASIYSPENQSQAIALEQIEVRAFGCLLEELLERCITSHQSQKTRTALWNLQLRCVQGERAARPLFAEIEQCLMIFKTQIHNEKLTSGNRQVNNPA